MYHRMIPLYKWLVAICLPQLSLKRALDDSFVPRIVANRVWILLLALLLAPAAVGQDAKSEFARFQLFNDCKSMNLSVEGLHDGAGKIGLTKARLQAAAESRLRSARLYDSDATAAYLYVNVNVSGPAFSISLKYNKWVFDPASVKNGYATTWDIRSTGTHGGGATFILSSLSEDLDRFLVEYLRVNESACSR